jgi:hypothetical protein
MCDLRFRLFFNHGLAGILLLVALDTQSWLAYSRFTCIRSSR